MQRIFPIAALLLASLAVRADSIADEADYRFRRGASLYRQGKVDEALGEFLASNRLVRNRNVLFNIARSFEKLQRPNEAYRWYTEILAEPELKEEDRSAVESALKRLEPSLALLRVETVPPGATLYIGRRDLGGRGQTPLTLALPPGLENAIVELPGFRPAAASADLKTGHLAKVQLQLERILGTLAVEGSPGRFSLRLDAADSSPLLEENGSARILPGDHQLFVSAPGFAAQQLQIRVPPDEQILVRFRLQPLPAPSGALVVRCNVDGALVRVDGVEAGFTPAVVEGIPVGTHKLEVLADGREPVARTVTLAEGQREPVEIRLRYAQPRVEAAERQLTRTQDAPASISIITAAEIRGFGYTTLTEALRSVRGLFISSDRNYDSLGVRGFSAPGTYNNRVLVLADGHITNDLSLGQGFIGHDFDTDLSNVERIEIVRGPGSVLYGSAAFEAGVNVVHRAPASGHAGIYHSDGERLFRSPSTSGPATGFARDVDGEDSAHADLHARAGDLQLHASINDRSRAVPTGAFDTVFGLPGTASTDTRWFAEAAYSRTLALGLGVDARASIDGRRHHAAWEYRGAAPGVGYPGTTGRLADWGDAELRLRLPSFLGNNLFVGGELQDVFRVRLTSFTPAGSDAGLGYAPDIKYAETIASVYAGDDLQLGARARLDAAVRFDDHIGSFGGTINPRLALIAQPYERGNTKLIFGTAYRAPSFYERYFANGISEVAANCAGCTPLQPEEIRTGEFEHTHQLNDDVSLLVAGYWSRISRILRLAQNSATTFAFGNRSTLTHSSGVEAEARWQPSPGALISLWYSFSHVTNDNGFIVPNVPTHTAALRVLLPLVPDLLSVSSEAVYGSTRYTAFVDRDNLETAVGEQLYLNFGVSGSLGSAGPRFSLFVLDALDQRPLIPAGLEVPFSPRAVPLAGRTFRATFAGSF
jgi:outer membrane receptor for ferrienterochelin and colicins